MMLSKLAFFASVAYSMAIQITSPEKNDIWETFKDQTISWNFVETDPKIAGIYLSNYVSINQNRFIVNVSVSDGSYIADTNSWPTGEGYVIKITNPENVDEVYAQSEGFTLTQPNA
ncbi:developmentally Regulated MAPK Interacting protein [Schizosaccharomyces cryophilus OY26]|uniref:Developmentally Regulated MAPK Interacting protein n=1 Tax=Schizosaccharomyces cryophilus (strain OY26 / ATCC MYA-4695 / CBS 11777 / NBRC 106824 / NRRL Y48691) TaxID=653667 RepID=S9X574_SCHCR|nr:developmentally Regulated MAPK Interacting protein [Schizosaccharomyces cryophilus OY26]EPY52247.1 developmentally Regulated MAPK Interacting protein [Schizosaccharomyces cryophilus OY26]